ncbi:MAG: hypothetical protein M1269_03300 [Chloroflexi bacterium]|nr:hypothetical protein [Chloroflexota bacterium]
MSYENPRQNEVFENIILRIRPMEPWETHIMYGKKEDIKHLDFQKIFPRETKAFSIAVPYYEKDGQRYDYMAAGRVLSFMWKSVFCDVLEALQEPNTQIVLRINGELYPKELLRVYRYLTDEGKEHRYFIREAANLERGPGYLWGEVGMEYDPELIRKMLADKDILFDQVMFFKGVVTEDKLVPKYLTISPFLKVEDTIVALEETTAIFGTFQGFDSMYIMSAKLDWEEYFNRLKKSLEGRAELIIKT